MKVTLFMFESCPHCKKALRLMDEVFSEHPEYKEIPFEMVDEQLEPERAAKYDYWYVPTFFVGDEKLHEGVIEKADVEKVFAYAKERE